MFSNFREVLGVFTRAAQETAFRAQMAENRQLADRTYGAGEVVFRRLPRPARMPKHMLPPPCTGPYHVVSHPTRTSLI